MPDVNDIMQARLVGTCGGEPFVNTFGFAVTNAQASWAEQATALYNDFDAAFGIGIVPGAWPTGLNSQYKLLRFDVADVYPGVNAAQTFFLGTAGTVEDDDAMPPNDCLCITWRSAFRGPGGRGRTYLTGFSEGAANAGYWESGAQTYALAIANAMVAQFGEFGVGTARFCIIHKTSNGGVKNGPITPLVPPEIKPMMSYSISNQVRSIGRRAVGRRIHRKRPV